MYPKGQSRSVTFDNPGVVSILCNVHADMSAYIVVVNSTIYTITDAKGNYTLTGIEPGTYKVQAWHESGAKSNQIVTVTGQDQSLDISLKK